METEMNRNKLRRALMNRYNLVDLQRCYRSKKGVIIYTTHDFSNIFVDLPNDDEYFQSDLGNGIIIDEKTTLPYMIPNYIRITRVLLKDDKVARNIFNTLVKNHSIFAGLPFKEFFTPTGGIDFDKVIEISECTKDMLDYIISDEVNNSEWGNYNPYNDPQLGLSNWLIN